MSERIYLSPPHMSGKEIELVQEAFAENWIAPTGPHLVAFEQEFCDYTGALHAVALSSGTAAIHIALLLSNVQPGDEVFVSTLTFAGSVNPILYLNAKPVFIDSEPNSWNMDPALLAAALADRAKIGKLPKAIIPVHLYGQSADMDMIMAASNNFEVPVIEDSAEALGTYYQNQHSGTFGKMGVFSFNGNKIITTSGGGMFVSADMSLVARARKLASQSREAVPHYEHIEVGYNYRMSNILAAIGMAQLRVIEDRVRRKREIYQSYRYSLANIPGLTFIDDMSYGRHTRWLTVILIDQRHFGADREQLRLKLEEHNIESRPLWKPMHLQPVFQGYEKIGGHISEMLFSQGLCLPSGTKLSDEQINSISAIIRGFHEDVSRLL